MERLWIRDIKEEARIRDTYLIKDKRVGTTRNGRPFLTLVLMDRTGEMEAKIWEDADRLSSLFVEGDICLVEGHAVSYQGKLQITISNLQVVTDQVQPHPFVESSPQDLGAMMKSLREILGTIQDRHLKALLDRFLADREFMARFKEAPAAKGFHHNYMGGLLEHTLSVCRMATQVADHYPQLHRDLLLTATFLHDIGKVRELSSPMKIDYTDEGRLVGHLVLGVGMVEDKLKDLKSFPSDLAMRLKHLILSHHGELQFGSPKRPKFLEAYALHLMDDLDAKMNGLQRLMERDRQEGAWTEYSRMFERYFLKGQFGSLDAADTRPKEASDHQQRLFLG